MSIVRAAGAEQLLKASIERDESRRLEFKRVSGKMVGKALETLSSPSNGDGS
jgi:hypothetical protein